MGDESLRRRDVLRSGVAAGLVWFGWTTGAGLAQDETTTAQEETTTTQDETTRAQDGTTPQSQQGQYAFSYSLQRGDRFVIRFRPTDSAGDPVTETVPSNCFGGGNAREFQLFVVRAYRGSIDLGYRDLFVPQQAATTESPETSPEAETTTEETTTEAALQDATTTVNETTPVDEETTPAEETTTETGTTPAEGQALPEIRRGEWYRVTSSMRCANRNRLTLATAEPPETTP